MENYIKRELFWNRAMFILIGGFIFLVVAVAVLMLALIAGSLVMDGSGAPGLFGGNIDRLMYGFFAVAMLSILAKNGVSRFWNMVRAQLREAYESQVANIYRSSRCSPEYYR